MFDCGFFEARTKLLFLIRRHLGIIVKSKFINILENTGKLIYIALKIKQKCIFLQHKFNEKMCYLRHLPLLTCPATSE